MMMVDFILVKPSVLQSTSWGHPFSEDDFEFKGWFIMLLISLLQVSERHLVVYQWYNYYWELRGRQEKCRSVCLLDRGLAHRAAPKIFEYPDVQPVQKVPYIPGGSWEQRNATLEVLMTAARELTADELQQAWNKTTCNEGQICTSDPRNMLH